MQEEKNGQTIVWEIKIHDRFGSGRKSNSGARGGREGKNRWRAIAGLVSGELKMRNDMQKQEDRKEKWEKAKDGRRKEDEEEWEAETRSGSAIN